MKDSINSLDVAKNLQSAETVLEEAQTILAERLLLLLETLKELCSEELQAKLPPLKPIADTIALIFQEYSHTTIHADSLKRACESYLRLQRLGGD